MTEGIVLEALRDVKVNADEFVLLRFKPRDNAGLFGVLVATILSQNTSDRNAIRAYENLKRRCGVITPESILSLTVDELAELIKPAGMHRVRAVRLLELAREVLRRFNGDLTWIFKEETQRARKTLLDLPGVGEKTADVVLLASGHLTFPVDTHITRITLRLGLVNSRRYSEIQRVWMHILTPNRDVYLEVHVRLIQFGREVCKARSPRCNACKFKPYCNFFRAHFVT